MEPLSLIATIGELLKMGGDVVRYLRKAVPEYGRFWDDFEAKLKNEYDVPWESIVSNCCLQPEFIGWAIGYIAGEDDARQAMAAHFASFLEPPRGSRLSKDELVAKVSQAAEQAASKAASQDRKADLANRKLVIAAIEAAEAELAAELVTLRRDVAGVRDGVDEIRERLGSLADERGVGIDQVEQSASRPRFLVDEKQIEDLLDRAADRFFKEQQARSENETLGEPPRAAEDAPEAVLPTTPGLEPVPPQQHLERLRSTNADAAAKIERIVRDAGVLGLATALRTDAIEHEVETLLAAARIVSSSGFFAEAEQAYLRAGEMDLAPAIKARQFVRAARVADVQGEEERCLRHLDHARRIDRANSTLAIAEARRMTDSERMLERVNDVQPADDDERALLHQTRAQAHLGLGNDEEARREYELAKEASANNLSVREFGAILALHEAQVQIAQGKDQDLGVVLEAAEVFEAMVEGLLRENRPIEAAAIISRAAEAFMVGHNRERAAAVCERLPAPELLPDGTRLTVAQAAIVCQRPDLVVRYVPPDTNESLTQLIRAEAEAELPGALAEEVARAVEVLEGFLDREDELAERAAFALLDVAVRRKDAVWNDEAAAIVARRRPDTEAGMRAERHLLLGEYDEAEATLLPVASSATTRRRLRDYALKAGHWDKAADRSRQLVRDYGDPTDRLALAEALRGANNQEGALAENLKVARDGHVEARVRDAAYGAAIEIVGTNRDYGAILDLAEEWRRDIPASDNALWNVLFGLARLSRHDVAYRLARDTNPDAVTPERATLLAEIYYRAAPPRDALTTITILSDRFDRKIEALEGLAIAVGLNSERDEIDGELAERLRDTIGTFEKRFPDSQTIRSFPAPQSAEEFEATLKELAGDMPALQAQMRDAVRDGRAPVHAFAAAGPDRVAGTWRELIIWPLGFATEQQDGLDRAAAAKAVGGAAVLDPSALVVLAELDVADKLIAALPGSAIANETLDDVDEVKPFGQRVARSEHLPDGSIVWREVGEEDEKRLAEARARILARAKALEILPPLGDGVSEELLRAYEEDDLREEFQALLGSLALAQRLGRPLYSDDRWVRDFARANGVASFGTLALLEDLAERALLTEEERRSARLRLTERGSWGVALGAEELIAAGRAGSFDLNRRLIGAFHDRATWRAKMAERFRVFAAFLGAVYDEAPDQFAVWIHRTLDAAHSAAPHMRRAWFGEVLLIMSWGLGDDDVQLTDDCFKALVEEVKHLPDWLRGARRDPVLGAIDQLLALSVGWPERERFHFFCLLVRRLRLPDAVRAIQTFLR